MLFSFCESFLPLAVRKCCVQVLTVRRNAPLNDPSAWKARTPRASKQNANRTPLQTKTDRSPLPLPTKKPNKKQNPNQLSRLQLQTTSPLLSTVVPFFPAPPPCRAIWTSERTQWRNSWCLASPTVPTTRHNNNNNNNPHRCVSPSPCVRAIISTGKNRLFRPLDGCLCLKILSFF